MYNNNLAIRTIPNFSQPQPKLIAQKIKAKKIRYTKLDDKRLQKHRQIIPILEDESKQCQNLWQAVIVQALQDLANPRKDSAQECRRAAAWVGQGVKKDHITDFEYVCDLANLPPSRVTKIVRKVMEEGLEVADCSPLLARRKLNRKQEEKNVILNKKRKKARNR